MTDDGWKTTPVSLDIPFHRLTKDPGTRRYIVGDLHHRSIVSVIRERVSDQKSGQVFHYYPYQATWSRTSKDSGVELFGEVYSSRVFRQADEALQCQPSGSRDQGLERVVVALMFWSDSTQLTSFGGASLWPCYLFFGNDSKYDRGRPSEHLGNQIAYLIKVDRWISRNHSRDYTDQILPASRHVLRLPQGEKSRKAPHQKLAQVLPASIISKAMVDSPGCGVPRRHEERHRSCVS